MHRIDSADIVTTLPTPAAARTAGYFSGGNVGTGVQGTIVDADWANSVQEELAHVIETSGQTLSKTNQGQLAAAVVRKNGDTMTGPLVVPAVFIGANLKIADNGTETTISWDYGLGHADSLDHSTGNRYFYLANKIVMWLDTVGNLYVQQAAASAFKTGGGTWGAISDARVKENVTPYSAGLDAVCALRPVNFSYNGTGGEQRTGKILQGLIAQEVREVMPECVFEMAEGADRLPNQLATDLGPLTLALVNACKELAARVQALEARAAA